jgi:ATP-dependent exoDNAse (exonuclease V) beta subunit
MTERVIDREARQAAIDPARSFIVQAPAGSGKTALLTQRYLRLLATVDAPEEILAITFTRKAAGEMRDRIVGALARAADDTPPAEAHEAETWRLARVARARDGELGWVLERHPARLRVQTMDAFNAALTRQMPLLSGLGSPPSITDRAGELYAAAARRTTEALESRDVWSEAIGAFLLHVDNRLDRAEDMIAGMLARRDQWLPHLLGDLAGDRGALEAAIAAEVRLHIQRVRDAIPERFHEDLVELAAFAAAMLIEDERKSDVALCHELKALPAADIEALPQWLGLAELLLTKQGGWRKTVTVATGFPSDRKDHKARMIEVLQRLSVSEGLDALIHRLRILPAARYNAEQWRLLEALQVMLPLAAAELQVVFAERGEVDHTEIALRAIQALGEEENPTDLALALDHRIRHVLVDEFQDTSTSQFRLLEALTRGWAPDDGRSLFLVGDPMQSIYRFREAEVGLFLRARREGVGDLPLTPLCLEVNFRSREPLVAWVNQGFPSLLAAAEDPGAGAVPFEAARAFDRGGEAGVGIHPMLGESFDGAAEAAAVAELARRRLDETGDGTVAILVRGRPQAAEILPALRAAGLSFQSVEIESLATRPVVQDLLALTRALVHEGDRTAWLAVLRAPWCGLALADLYAVAGDDGVATLPERLADPEVLAALSADGRARLERILPALQQALIHRRRESLRHRVETTWLAVGGPAAAGSPAALEDAEAYLNLLEASETAADLDDVNELDEALSSLYARPDPEGSERLQVMTIHKSKGLEFDTVILPGLHAGGGRDDPPLLQWMERPRLGAGPDLLLAPLRPAGQEDRDPLYAFVSELAKEKDEHEQGRLLYVAVTRAIRRLELFGFVKLKPGEKGVELGTPRRGSLLARLWPVVESAWCEAHETWQPSGLQAEQSGGAAMQRLRRLPAHWTAPEPESTVEWEGGVAEVDSEDGRVEYEWAGETARLVGTVVHRVLQQIADDGIEQWDGDRVRSLGAVVRAMLSGLGADPASLAEAEDRSLQALATAVEDEAGRWILAPHAEAANEIALSSWGLHGPETHIIDRSFVDEQDTRWIIDYKTGYREGGDVEGFLQQELERHAPQMRRYAEAFQALDGRIPRVGLYFPLMGRFCEVS